MNQKILIIIASDRKIKDFLVETIAKVIGHEVIIKGYSLDEGVEGPKTADLVLTSGKYTIQQAKLIFPNCDIIPSERVITGYNLEQVMMLPRGKKVLVVNHPVTVSEETIENLKNLGITHLEYVPYCKGKQIDSNEIDTAISPGMIHLCPESIKNRIDIGGRSITIQTFIEVLFKLNLSLKYVDVFENHYNRLLMEAARKMETILKLSDRLRKNQEVILNEIEEGILSVNEQNQIMIANPAMNKLFGNPLDFIHDKNFQELTKRLENVEVFLKDSSSENSEILFTNLNKKLICNKSTVRVDNDKHFIYTFREVAQIQKLEQKVRSTLYKKGYVAKHNFNDIWGNNQRIIATKKKANIFAQTEETILITGESGTGKELFAQAIHRNSLRRDGPFVAMNFAAIPENLVESELFGYEEGAFTGARKGGKPGIFELAHGGTLLLDEIGDAPLYIQARLLRVLEEREIMSLGGSRLIPIDVRVIAATNKDLMDYVKQKMFRTDLFYRLSVLTLETPPLREFREEIPPLLDKYLLNKYNIKNRILPEVAEFLLKYDWPGNMREMRNVADYMYYSSLGRDYICNDDIPGYLRSQVEVSSTMSVQNVFNETKIKLEVLGNIKEFEAIIDVYYNQDSIGRNKLMELLNENGYYLTENKVKKCIKILKTLGLITTGRTKQGTSLTYQGKEFYRN